MDNKLHNDNDGLEDFFHDRLFGFQDEPGLDMWERIQNQIPEKPKRNLKPIFIWASRAVAACLILTLGIFNYQYRNQLDHVASQLQDSNDSMASLEAKINGFYDNLASQQVAQTVAEIDENINTNPRIQQTASQPQVIYLPVYTNESLAIVASETKVEQPKRVEQKNTITSVSKAKSNPKTTSNTSSRRQSAKGSIMAFASNHFNIANKEDILDLRKKLITTKNPIFINKKKLNVPSSQLAMKKGNWGMGNDNTGIVSNLPKSRTSRKSHFKSKEADSVMKNWTSEGNRLQQAEKSIDWDKVIGIGANYSINNNLSFFMGPDYWESSKKPSVLSTNDLYPYTVGIESGVTYHF